MLDMIWNNGESCVLISPLNFNLGLFKITPKEKEKKQLPYIHSVLFLRIFPLLHKPPNELWNAFRQEDKESATPVGIMIRNH